MKRFPLCGLLAAISLTALGQITVGPTAHAKPGTNDLVVVRVVSPEKGIKRAQNVLPETEPIFLTLEVNAAKSRYDVELSGILLRLETVGGAVPEYLQDCRLVWDQGESANVSLWTGVDTYHFTFDEPLIVPKRGTVTLRLKGRIPNGARAGWGYCWGTIPDFRYQAPAYVLHEGMKQTCRVNSIDGSMASVITAGKLEYESFPVEQYAQVIEDVPSAFDVGAFRLRAKDENVRVHSLRFRIDGNATMVHELSFWLGERYIGYVPVNGQPVVTAPILPFAEFDIKKDTSVLLTVKMHHTGSQDEGTQIGITLLTVEAEGLQTSGRITVNSLASSKKTVFYRTRPEYVMSAQGQEDLCNGVISRFMVTLPVHEAMIGRITLKVEPVYFAGEPELEDLYLEVTNPALGERYAVHTSGQLSDDGLVRFDLGGQSMRFSRFAPLEIEVRAKNANSLKQVTVSVEADEDLLIGSMAALRDTDAKMIWSTDPQAEKWHSGYGLNTTTLTWVRH